MDIKEYLGKYEVLEAYVEVQDVKYDYIEAKYVYNDNQYAKFYIIDIINHEEYAKKWENYEKFEEFQRELLEDVFFTSIGDLRFNLYLVFVATRDSSIFKNIKIQRDFKYARKILLTEQEVPHFFDVAFQFHRENDSNYTIDTNKKKELLEKMRRSNEKARNCLEQVFNAYLCIEGDARKRKKFETLKGPLTLSGYIDECLKMEKKGRKIHFRTVVNSGEYKVKGIESVFIKNYRCFKKTVDIPFRKVNLIYGENGVGKTSLLEAIEFGVTGVHRKNERESRRNVEVEVRCRDTKGQIRTMKSQTDNYKLAESWYGVKVESCQEFNKLFGKCNYFDTSWASSFAIEGRNQMELLSRFLEIDDIERVQILVVRLYEDILKISKNNLKIIGKRTKKLFATKNIKTNSEYKRILDDTNNVINICENELSVLEEDMNKVTLHDILNAYIKKIQSIYKLLISTTDYDELRVRNGEIVAMCSETGEMLSMAKMSTGQKVCLALAVMFALFLSYDFAPNIIMLDEPVANLDDLHMLNLLDVLRKFALSDTQIFFTTANPDVAKLFRRKFSFLEKDFGFFTVEESESDLKIIHEEYVPDKEEPVYSRIIK